MKFWPETRGARWRRSFVVRLKNTQTRNSSLLRERRRDYSAAANAIALSIERFPEATVLFSFCLSGDGWDDFSATDERWKRYRRWRAAHREDRRLYEAPGHQFESHEVEHLSKAIALRSNLAGTLWSPPSPDDRFCSSRTTIGWRSIEVSRAVCL